jgi:hypothetical protein
MGHCECDGRSVFGGGPTHRRRRTCDRCDACPGCDPSVGVLSWDDGSYYCRKCRTELKIVTPLETYQWGERDKPVGARKIATDGPYPEYYGGGDA